jgi:hypothetical protein
MMFPNTCTQPCCEPVRMPTMHTHYNSFSPCGCEEPTRNTSDSYNNSHTVVTHNYIPRPVSCGCDHRSNYYGAIAHVSHRSCGCAPQTNCSCQASYGTSSDCGCSGSGGNSTTGNVPANAPAAPYIIASQLAPGKYMVTAADNVSGGSFFVGTANTAKTIGTEFTITTPTDIFFTVNTVSSAPSSIRLTKI